MQLERDSYRPAQGQVCVKWRLAAHAALVLWLHAVSLAFPIFPASLPQTAGLTVSADFVGRELAPQDVIELRLNRPLTGSDGKLAVFIGATDISDLLTIAQTRIRYRPLPLPLPPGESEVRVWLISASREWRQLAVFTLRVTASAVITPEAPSDAIAPGAQETTRQRGLTLTPQLGLGLKSQPAEAHSSAQTRPERTTFTDFTLQGSLATAFERGSFGWQSQFDIVGSSYRPEALRYGLLGKHAPLVDLSNYLMQLRFGTARLSAGQISHGRERHLINEFASRGIALATPLGARADVSIAAQNGTSLVGWGNFFGLNRRDHQITSATFGYELLPKLAEQPARSLRVETSLLTGSLLPLNNFNQGTSLTDAAKSRGASVRVLASDAAERLRLDAGFARSHSVNPPDPLLDFGQPVIGVRPTTDNAHYLDASYFLLKNHALTGQQQVNLQVNYQHERVAPQFRSVAAELQPNKLLNQIGLAGNAGEVNFTFSHLRLKDNLEKLPTLLTTLTRRNLLTLGAPLRAFFGQPAQAPERAAAWLPVLAYAYDRIHQFGAGLPAGGEFKEAQVPNQVATHQSFAAEWQGLRWRYGYKLDLSAQDNFGPKRTKTKLRNAGHGLTLGFTPHTAFDVNFELGRERSRSADDNANKDPERTDRTWRYTLFANWRPSRRTALTLNLANLSARGFGAITLTDQRRHTQFDGQWSWRFLGQAETEQAASGKPRLKPKGQFFVRYSYRSAYTLSELLNQNSSTRGHTLHTGVNFTFF